MPPAPNPSPPTILFEDSFLIVLAKPAGWHSVAAAGLSDQTAADWLRSCYPDLPAAESGLSNRLDRMTSGCLIAARTDEIKAQLRGATRSGAVQKRYLAVLEDELPEEAAIVETFIGSPRRRAQKVRVYSAQRERSLPARSEFTLLDYDPQRSLSVARVELEVGRRHQVRAHAAFIKHPLLGDALYGARRKTADLVCSGGEFLPDFFLHAFEISLIHPVTNRALLVRAPAPWYLSEFAEKW
jgi:RluA family pseudouridine synthase